MVANTKEEHRMTVVDEGPYAVDHDHEGVPMFWRLVVINYKSFPINESPRVVLAVAQN